MRVGKKVVLKLAGACGIAGPSIFSGLIIVLGAAYPGYSHIIHTISVLGAVDAPHKVIMNITGFILLGLSVMIFAAGVESSIKKRGVLWIGPGLIVFSGIMLVMTGIFSGDAYNIESSRRAIVHSTIAFVAAIAFAAALIFTGLRQWWDPRWRKFAIYSEVTATTTLLFYLVSGLDILEPYAGLFQRIAMGLSMVWVVVTSVKLLLAAAGPKS